MVVFQNHLNNLLDPLEAVLLLLCLLAKPCLVKRTALTANEPRVVFCIRRFYCVPIV